MRKRAYSAAAVASSVALLTFGAPTASQAYTQKELNLCWSNASQTPSQDLEVVADGPSYKTFSLDTGSCMAWDVKPGQYKITLEDVDEFMQGFNASCPGPGSPSLKITVKRQNTGYKAYPLAALLNGSITTNVKKDRRTTVSAYLRCV